MEDSNSNSKSNDPILVSTPGEEIHANTSNTAYHRLRRRFGNSSIHLCKGCSALCPTTSQKESKPTRRHQGLGHFGNWLSGHPSRKTEKCDFCPIVWGCLERCISEDNKGVFRQVYDDARNPQAVITQEDHFDSSVGVTIGESTLFTSNKSMIIRIGIFDTWRTSYGIEETFEVFTSPNESSPWPAIGAAKILPRNTASKTSARRAKGWMNYCLKNHRCCHLPKNSSVFPRRLLDVSGNSVKLVEIHNQDTRYLCLSHCWGDPIQDPRPLETTRKNLHEHQNNIPWSTLPRTFQDAVLFVRSLGESHIWIDSLCIIQDCAEDWYQESAKMASIYRNSFLTLAATKSTNSSEGLFSIPDDKYESHPFNLTYEDGSFFTIYCRKALPHWYGPRWMKDCKTPPLFKRAWIFQERTLSPRVLHFENQELVWECKEITTCECSLWVDHTKPAGMFKRLLDFDHPEKEVLPEGGAWQSAVIQYSQLDLTKASDRLPAIAGVAKQLQTYHADSEYLAGLWTKSLLEDMAWYTQDNTRSSRNTTSAPSWSWACLDKALITFRFRRGNNEVNMRNTKITLVSLAKAEKPSNGQDEFVESPCRSITIKGYIFPANMSTFCPFVFDFSRPYFNPFDFKSRRCISYHEPVQSAGPRTYTYLDDLSFSHPAPSLIPFQSPSDHHCHAKSICQKCAKQELCTDCPEYGLPPSHFHIEFYPDWKFSQSDFSGLASIPVHCLLLSIVTDDRASYSRDIFLVLRQKGAKDCYERIGLLERPSHLSENILWWKSTQTITLV